MKTIKLYIIFNQIPYMQKRNGCKIVGCYVTITKIFKTPFKVYVDKNKEKVKQFEFLQIKLCCNIDHYSQNWNT